jgi:uncharacterized protein YlxW (UPF0749 family)
LKGDNLANSEEQMSNSGGEDSSLTPQDRASSDVKLKNRHTERILFMILLIFLGCFITMQIRESITVAEKYSSLKLKYGNYQVQLENLEKQKTDLQAENTQLNEQRDALANRILNEQGYSEMAASLAQIKAFACLTNVEGSGITVTLNDSDLSSTTDTTSLSVIHSQDIQYVVDLLKAAGAKAIAINGERIVGTTVIECTGPTVRVNNSRYPVPFVVTAVCDPDAAANLFATDSYIAYRLSGGVEIDVSKNESILIPAFSDSETIDSLYIDLKGSGES